MGNAMCGLSCPDVTRVQAVSLHDAGARGRPLSLLRLEPAVQGMAKVFTVCSY